VNGEEDQPEQGEDPPAGVLIWENLWAALSTEFGDATFSLTLRAPMLGSDFVLFQFVSKSPPATP
jgi:hypothetical protein